MCYNNLVRISLRSSAENSHENILNRKWSEDHRSYWSDFKRTLLRH